MTLLPLPSLVVWLTIDIVELPRTPVMSCGLFFNWPYSWKLTPMTRSELLTPSVSERPSPLGLEFPSRESLGGFLEKKLEHSEKLET